MNVYTDAKVSDAARRRGLYDGSVFTYSPGPSALALCQFARTLIEEAFRPLDPMRLHETMPSTECARILGELKPKFIHHPRSKECIQGMLSELGCDPQKTYFDVPRMRTAYPGDYLNSGIAYAFHPHRDTWYSAPFCQINWWMPIYDVSPDNCMAFHPAYWDRPLKNSSAGYNYHRWNQESRFNAAQFVKGDTRVQPKPEEEVELEPQLRVISNVGGVFLFSAAQLHSTVPNTSGKPRYSIDFRTVHLDDVLGKIGAPNIDSACTGTTMGDYLRATDFAHLPAEALALYQDGSEVEYAAPAAAR